MTGLPGYDTLVLVMDNSMGNRPGESGDGSPVGRLFRPEDAPALTVMLHSAYAELAAAGLNYTAADQDVATTLGRATGGRCWLVEDAGVPVATLTVSLPPGRGIRALTSVARREGAAWLNQVAVAPTHRGRGLTSSLWWQALNWAMQQGVQAIGVDTAESAAHLIDMYTRWGFIPMDTVHWAGKNYRSAVLLRDCAVR